MGVRRSIVILALLAAAVVLAACGSDGDDAGGADAGAQPAPPSTAGLPPKLADNLEEANTLVGEGTGDLEARIAELQGHPIVVNQWASWCEPCRFEFPFFRSMVAEFRDRVAFVGLDSQDERGAAEAFLREVPADFPSIFDPDGSAAASLGGGRAFPTTIFLDDGGEPVHVKLGAYATAELLEQDIRRHALGEAG